jgi:hypothetical protein
VASEKRLQEYRLPDQIAIAYEKGIGNPLERVTAEFPFSVGALVELAILKHFNPVFSDVLSRYRRPSIVRSIYTAQQSRNLTITGQTRYTKWGAFCLSDVRPDNFKEHLFSFELAARKAMPFKRSVSQAKANICGALQELVDNIFEHSESAQTGLLMFLGAADSFELAVGDAGIGVLASLRSNPAYSFLTDSGAALTFALTDGHSRYGRSEGRGSGFTTLFRALRTLDADLRFRSGNYSLEVVGRSPALNGAHLSQKAQLRGFVVSLRLRF